MTTLASPLCSADGHLIEPHDLWQARLPRSLRGRAIRSEQVDGVDGQQRWYNHEGQRYLTSGPFQSQPGQEPPGADPGQRLRDIAGQGIWAETVFPNLGLQVFSIADRELALASARAYNDYVFEAYAPYRDRLITVPIIPVLDIDDAVAEVERVATADLRGILLPLVPPVPYTHFDLYEPLWAAAEHHAMPVSLHVGTGFVTTFGGETVPYPRAGLQAGTAASTGAATGVRVDDRSTARTREANRTVEAARIGREAQEAIAALVGSGALERFPDLHVVSVESNANWLGTLMVALDKAWAVGIGQPRSYRVVLHDTVADPDTEVPTELFGHRWRYPLKPSEYVRRQVHATFMDDPGALAFRTVTGIEPLLWGSDYPHPEGVWPETQAAIDQLFVGVPADEQQAILGGTLAALYDIPLPETEVVAPSQR